MRLSFSKGEYLSKEGESLDYLYIVVSGRAKVLLSLSDGKQLLLANFISRGIIGDVELMTNIHAHQTTLQAVTDFECIAIPLNDYRETLKSNNEFVKYIAQKLAEKLTQRAINGAINTLQPLEARLCAYIMQTAKGGQFNECLTAVAVMVGASYRHVHRLMGVLCGKEILQKHGKSYYIINPHALKDMSGDLYML